MKAENAALQENNISYADGHNFEDAVKALEDQLKDGVQSALHEPPLTVAELRRELENENIT